jgi:hypothetical protein
MMVSAMTDTVVSDDGRRFLEGRGRGRPGITDDLARFRAIRATAAAPFDDKLSK